MMAYSPYDYGIFHEEEDDTSIFPTKLGLSDPVYGCDLCSPPAYSELSGEGFFQDLGRLGKKAAQKGLAAGKVAFQFAEKAYQNPTVRKAVNSVLEQAAEYAKDQLSETDAAIITNPLIDLGMDHIDPQRPKRAKAKAAKKNADDKKRTDRKQPKKKPVEDLHNTVFPDVSGEGLFTNRHLIGLNSF